ncbi:MAG: malonyl-ACP O-methyltransferase BioC [Gammaproteobacteria bacterium]|nr:malonyl-ACP O-methyltransferase BioC [Gammaproteobacteria bacterium]
MTAELDKRQVRMAFSRAAPSYDQVAVLQREIGQRMLDRLELVKLQPTWVLDLGAGTGEATADLARRYPRARILALDFAFPMLLRARRKGPLFRKPGCLCADLEQLPLANQSVDLIYSNVALQWCSDFSRTLSELLRVLKPGGLLMFSTFGPDTLWELRDAWSEVDGFAHVSSFLDMHDLGDALLRTRFAEPVMDVDRITTTYTDVGGLMRDLKLLGAHNATTTRRRGLTGKGRMNAMREAYERHRIDGRLPASYEVVYGHAWAPLQRQEEAGVTLVSADRIGRL